MYVGFSASTGLLASSHYVLGWSFKIRGESKSLDLDSLPSPPGIKKRNTKLIYQEPDPPQWYAYPEHESQSQWERPQYSPSQPEPDWTRRPYSQSQDVQQWSGARASVDSFFQNYQIVPPVQSAEDDDAGEEETGNIEEENEEEHSIHVDPRPSMEGSSRGGVGKLMSKVYKRLSTRKNKGTGPSKYTPSSYKYKYIELKKATKNFKESELLGSGGFGRVYKGTLRNPKAEVAVKRVSHDSKQGIREFVSEISSIGRLRHRNLVQLQGWCRRGGDLLLVYDFMPNGSLDRYLFDTPKCILSYEQIVLHRDVKASNVLLDAEMNCRLGDFGLAKLYDHGSNSGTTRVVGTLGYLAPELPRTGRSTTGSDVYAFGALMLEVACGRRPIKSRSGPDELVLVDYVWSKWKGGRIVDVVDERMKGEFEEKEVVMVLKLGLMCSSHQQSGRPSMRQLVRYLEGEIEVPEVWRAPGVCADDRGFEDYLNSYASSSFDKSTNGDTSLISMSISTSPITVIREAR
ncbi:hypothetical protein SASPL_102025 [Salvia splendens]|uniref:non-specific serine/threonine protein kinase n=2 Tax=Salvia splendens TaxID=180675 RepID=A0A8X8YQG1_SALSN|nr:hypothetical protein SASPL_102025 [Salvia splendens]